MYSLLLKLKPKFILKIFVFAISFILLLVVLHRFDVTKSLAKKFGLYNEIRIEDTAILVDEIKKLKQLYTSKYYDEFYLEYENYEQVSLLGSNGLIGIVANGYVSAGFDLEALDEYSIIIDKENDSIILKIAKPEIIETIINPSGFQTFISRGNVPFKIRKNAQIKAKQLLKIRAFRNGILKISEEKGKRFFKQFFLQLGFKNVKVEIIS